MSLRVDVGGGIVGGSEADGGVLVGDGGSDGGVVVGDSGVDGGVVVGNGEADGGVVVGDSGVDGGVVVGSGRYSGEAVGSCGASSGGVVASGRIQSRQAISTVILDWAGTVVDYGCLAPVTAFIEAFSRFGIVPSLAETRAPMGLPKRAHIEKMLAQPRLAALWQSIHGRAVSKLDIDQMYDFFEPALFAVLPNHTDLLPGVVKTVTCLRQMGLVIGSTTGYTREMMDVVSPLAAKQGYTPDYLVCPEDVGGKGRPYPYMLWRNTEQLGTLSIQQVIKVGDTIADIEEAKNAGCLAIGVVKGSSLLGLSRNELEKLVQKEASAQQEQTTLGEGAAQYGQTTLGEASALFEQTRQSFLAAGADYVLDDIELLPALIKSINDSIPLPYIPYC